MPAKSNSPVLETPDSSPYSSYTTSRSTISVRHVTRLRDLRSKDANGVEFIPGRRISNDFVLPFCETSPQQMWPDTRIRTRGELSTDGDGRKALTDRVRSSVKPQRPSLLSVGAHMHSSLPTVHQRKPSIKMSRVPSAALLRSSSADVSQASRCSESFPSSTSAVTDEPHNKNFERCTQAEVERDLASQGHDGTVEMSLIRRSSSSPEDVSPDRPKERIVRFASSDDLHTSCVYPNKRRTVSQFLDPFAGSPLPPERSFSNISDMSTYLRADAFAGHRDTLARIGINLYEDESEYSAVSADPSLDFIDFARDTRQCLAGHHDTLVLTSLTRSQQRTLPMHVMEQILARVSFEDYKSLRLICHDWLCHLPPPTLPNIFALPAEIVHGIYSLLSPSDFDAARHTCRAWFLHSLDSHLSHIMMTRAGCKAAFRVDIEHYQAIMRAYQPPRVKVAQDSADKQVVGDLYNTDDQLLDEEWLASNRLATTTRLSASWRGSGLHHTTGHSLQRLSVVEIIEFDRLVLPDAHDGLINIPKFRTSTCGSFLLAIVNTNIFVYSLCSGDSSLKPVSHIIASAKVLSVSMDTSLGWFAIAAILEGRKGACWELCDSISGGTALISASSNSTGERAVVYDSATPQTSSASRTTLTSRGKELAITAALASRLGLRRASLQNTSSESKFREFQSSHKDVSPRSQSSDKLTHLDAYHLQPLSTGALRAQIKPSMTFEGLGTLEEPPRSIAICPQRRCVAFGCKNGIELHWNDPLTGHALDRWIPLAAPSDHLYFLPSRPGINSDKRLRLISSAAGPLHRVSSRHNSNPVQWKRFQDTSHRGRARSMTRLFFGNLPSPSSLTSPTEPVHPSSPSGEANEQGVLRTVDCDQYCAIPLSDGFHIIFIDPETGILCLGSDAPLGSPAQLIRKVCMVPPSNQNNEVDASLVSYTVGRDLRWGVHVVAAHDDGGIILYHIPSDCFEYVRHVRSSPDVWNEDTGVLGQSDLLMDVFMPTPNNPFANAQRIGMEDSTDATDDLDQDLATPFRSLRIDGVLILHTKSGVEDMAVDCAGGGLKLWLFHADETAEKLDVYVPRDHEVLHRRVGADGLIYDIHSSEESKDS